MIASSSTEDEFVDLYCRNRPYKTNTLPQEKNTCIRPISDTHANHDNFDIIEQCLFPRQRLSV